MIMCVYNRQNFGRYFRNALFIFSADLIDDSLLNDTPVVKIFFRFKRQIDELCVNLPGRYSPDFRIGLIDFFSSLIDLSCRAVPL